MFRPQAGWPRMRFRHPSRATRVAATAAGRSRHHPARVVGCQLVIGSVSPRCRPTLAAMVSVGFITNQIIRRGSHHSVQALEADIRARVKGWNEGPNLRLDQDRRRDPPRERTTSHMNLRRRTLAKEVSKTRGLRSQGNLKCYFLSNQLCSARSGSNQVGPAP